MFPDLARDDVFRLETARLVAISGVKGRRQPGSLRGKLRVPPEFFEPLPADELAGWE